MFQTNNWSIFRDLTNYNHPYNPAIWVQLLNTMHSLNNVKFNVFHVRAPCYTKTLITNKCTKRVLSPIVTHSYMFRPCWIIFRENFFVIFTLRLHFIIEWEYAVDCVLRCFRRREFAAVPACRPAVQAGTSESSRLQYTVNSTFSLNYKVQL
jgi:hypothetical protein